MSIKDKFLKWWYFHITNPVVREGEAGGFKWKFRRFWLDISTVSGNWSMRCMAAEHPYGYLVAGKDDGNIQGYCATMYYLSQVLTTDQKLVNDIEEALRKYEKRLNMVEVDPDDSEEAAIAEVKGVQEYVEMDKKERRKYERDVNGRFKKRAKEAENDL